MEKVIEENLKKIVELYFEGYSAADAIKKVIKKNPLQRVQE